VNAIIDPIRMGVDATQQAADRAGLPPWATAVPLAAMSGAIESFPGPQKGAAKAGKAGKWVEAADRVAADMPAPGRQLPSELPAPRTMEQAADAAIDTSDIDFAGKVLAHEKAGKQGPIDTNFETDADIARMMDEPVGSGNAMTRKPATIHGSPESRTLPTTPSDGVARRNRASGVDSPQSNNAMSRQRGAVDNTGAGKEILKTQATRNALTNATGFIADDRPRIPEYQSADHPTPKPKAKHEFSGAPKNSPKLGGRTVESVADEAVLIEDYLTRAEAGAEARYWYDDVSARFNRDTGNVSGDRPGAADQQAAVFGHYSAGTAVPQNRLAQVRANNQFATGSPIEAGTPQRNADALQTFSESAVNPSTKLKTGLFGMQSRGIPTPRGTHDFRDAINWGYDVKDSQQASKVIGPAQHRWMDDMADKAVAEANKRKLGGFDDWTHERLQAAGWVAQKAESKGVPIASLKDEVATADEWLRANVYHEAIPSGELVNMNAMNDLDKRAYTAAYSSKTANPQGQNALAHQTGVLSPEQTKFVGEWDNKLNPNMVTTIMADPAKGMNIISSWSEEAVKFNGALNGILGGQADVAYSFLRPEKIAGNVNSYRVPVHSPIKEADLASYSSVTRKKLREADAHGSVIYNRRSSGELEATYLPADTAEWNKIQKLADEAKPLKAKDRTPDQKEAFKQYNDEMKTFRSTIEGTSNDRAIQARNSGGLITWEDSYKPSAWMEHLQNPKMRKAVEDVIPKVAADIKRDIGSLPLTKKGREVYVKTLELLESGGLSAVEQAVKNGTLPAAVLGALLFSASPDQAPPGQEQGRRQPMTEG